MIHFNRELIDDLDNLYRINLINSTSGYKSANLIGSKDRHGVTNLAVFSSVIHMGSNPPLLGFILRPTKVTRHTYTNIKESKFYTINHIADSFAEQAHHTSAKYASGVSEFDVTGLGQEYLNNFFAPFVKESPVKIAMRYIEEYEVESNGTILIIGEIVDLYLKEDLLEKDGFIDLSKGKIASINGLDGYSFANQPKRFGYQRPRDTQNPVTAREMQRSNLI
jgi:flavin reductase (DIM6/NTAB) family NADH-FMN oxidoreductase RutF